MNRLTKKVVSVGLSLATAVWLSGAAIVPVAYGLTADEIQAQIQTLLASIAQLQTQLAALQGGSSAGTSYSFTRDLTVGSVGDDVKALQQYLNASGNKIAASGVGSTGSESTYFGGLTKAALVKWQAANAVTPSTGYFGPKSRAKYTTLAGLATPATPALPTVEGLAIALASDTPGAKTLGSGTAFNSALKVNLTAGSKDVKITGITLQKSGFIANTNLNGVDIVDSLGVRHGQVVTSINADNTITILMTSDPIVVKAGTSGTATVRFNLLSGAYTGTVNFTIASVSALTTDTASVTGTFPLTGAIMNVIDGSASLAAVTVSILASTGSSTLNVDAASSQEITKFRISETSSKEGLNLNKWVFYNYGNAGATDYKDVTLVAQTGTVLATVQPVGQYVTFDLTASPYFIDKGLVKDFTIKATIVGGTTKTIKLVTYNDYDLDIRGATTGVSIIPTATGNDINFPVGNQWNLTTIGSGNITLQRASDSPSSAVTPGATNVVLAKFLTKPTGENYELRQVKFYIATSTTAGAKVLTGTVYVKVNGSIVYSIAASSISVSAQTTVNLSSYPILTASQDNTITIEGSISSSATAVSTYLVKEFDLTSAKRLVSNDLLSEDDAGLAVAKTDGLTISVQAAKLAVTTLATPISNSVVVGISNYEFGTIQLNAQSGGEDVKITTIVVTDTKVGSTWVDVSNLSMYKDSETSALATTASTAVNAATVTFTFSTPIVVTKATPVTLHLKANVVSDTDGFSTSTHAFNVASSTSAVSATGVSTGNSLTSGSDITYAGSGQAMTIVATGQLALSLVSGSGASPSINQLISAGTTGATVFAFKLTSLYEAQKITTLRLTATTTANGLATTTLTNIKLYEGTAITPFASAAQFDDCDASKCQVAFTANDNLLSVPVPVTGVTIYAKADVAAGGAVQLGDNFKFLIASSTADVAVKGSITGKTTGTKTGTPTASGITYVVPQKVAVSAVSPTVAVNVGTGSGQTVAIFKIANTGASAVYLSTSTMSFAKGGSASTSLSFALYSSAMGGVQGDSSITYITTSTAYGTSSTVPFDMTLVSEANRKIDGGSYRFLSIKTNAAAANNDTFQFAVSALGNILFNVVESDLGYSGNPVSDSDLNDTIFNLYVEGTPSLETVTAKS